RALRDWRVKALLLYRQEVMARTAAQSSASAAIPRRARRAASTVFAGVPTGCPWNRPSVLLGRPDLARAGRGGRAAHQLLEPGVAVCRIEIGVVAGERAEQIRTFDREPKVLDRVGRSSCKALAAGHVVQQHGVLGVSF